VDHLSVYALAYNNLRMDYTESLGVCHYLRSPSELKVFYIPVASCTFCHAPWLGIFLLSCCYCHCTRQHDTYFLLILHVNCLDTMMDVTHHITETKKDSNCHHLTNFFISTVTRRNMIGLTPIIL
jgi:hypothetical protein